MAKNFSLSSLVPDPSTFTDTDGKKYDVRTPKLLGAVDYAKINRLQRDLPKSLEKLTEVDAEDVDAAERAAQEVDDHLNAFVKLLVPELPMERIRKIEFGYKTAFLDWWRSEQVSETPDAAGE